MLLAQKNKFHKFKFKKEYKVISIDILRPRLKTKIFKGILARPTKKDKVLDLHAFLPFEIG